MTAQLFRNELERIIDVVEEFRPPGMSIWDGRTVNEVLDEVAEHADVELIEPRALVEPRPFVMPRGLLARIVFPDRATAERYMPMIVQRSSPDAVGDDHEELRPESVWWPLTKLPMIEASNAAHAWRRLAADDWVLAVTPCDTCGGAGGYLVETDLSGDFARMGKCFTCGHGAPDFNAAGYGLVPVFRAQTAEVVPVLPDQRRTVEQRCIEVISASYAREWYQDDDGDWMHRQVEGDFSGPDITHVVRFVPGSISPVTSEETT